MWIIVEQLKHQWITTLQCNHAAEWELMVWLEYFHFIALWRINVPGNANGKVLNVCNTKIVYTNGRRQNGALQCCTTRHSLILIQRRLNGLRKYLFNNRFYGWNSCATANKFHRWYIVNGQTCVEIFIFVLKFVEQWDCSRKRAQICVVRTWLL